MKRLLSVAATTMIAASLLLASVGSALAMTASAPTSNGGIIPYIIEGANPGGNRTCEEVGLAFFGDADYYEYSSDRVNYPWGAMFPEPGISVTVTDGTYVAFTSTFPIGAVIVKGSDDANVYVYDPQALSDSGLAAPFNASGMPAGLSNLTFCWNPVDENGGEWCSPGFWRNHYDEALVAANAGGFSLTDPYSDFFAPVVLSKKALTDGATANPSLWQVLLSPQWYGGTAFNNVGNLLSDAHPDVDYQGTQPDGTCPLGGRANWMP